MPTYRKHERLPEEGEEAEHVPELARGRKFYKVYDDHLWPLRNGIGHIFLEDMTDETSPERSTDEYEFVSEVYVYLSVAHRIARTMLAIAFGANGMARLALQLQDHNAPNNH